MKDSYRLNLKRGAIIKLKRKPTPDNNATEVYRAIKEIDFIKKTISCDDNIVYKFKDLL